MSDILSLVQAGAVSVYPQDFRYTTNDTLAQIVTPGYINEMMKQNGWFMRAGDTLTVSYANGTQGAIFQPTFSGQVITLVPIAGTVAGNVTGHNLGSGTGVWASTVNDVLNFKSLDAGTGITITNTATDITAAITANGVNFSQLANPIVATSTGMNVSYSTNSATPGTVRTIKGVNSSTATTMTSGNLVGVRGEVDMVGASGGFAFGVQGKVIPTGTLSGSDWIAPVFAQFDISAATVNAGQTAPVWADYGATSGTITSATGMRMFAGTNTTAATLFAMDYRYGKATNLLELDGNAGTYITSGGSGTHSGTIEKIAISIDGVTYYIVASTVVS